MAAPTANVAADVSAACTGRAVVISEIPSSSRAWAAKASFAISCSSDLPRKRRVDPALDVNVGKLIELKVDVLAQLLAFAREIGLFGIRLRTDGHIFASRHRHGAGHQSRNARDQDFVLRCGRRSNADEVETMPSLAPSTAALNHPMRLTR